MMLTVLGFCHSFGRQNPGFVCCYPYARVDAKPGFGNIIWNFDSGNIHDTLTLPVHYRYCLFIHLQCEKQGVIPEKSIVVCSELPAELDFGGITPCFLLTTYKKAVSYILI